MASRVLLWAGRLALPVLLMVGIAVVSRLPMGEAAEQGVLRLSWRMVGEPVELCRPYTEAERRSIPQHMQQRGEVCDRLRLPYRLRVHVDGALQLDRVVQPGGMRGDRPLFVQRDFPLPPGEHAIRVAFVPEARLPAEGADPAYREAHRAAVAGAPRFGLEEQARIREGRVLLIELYPRGQGLRVVEG